MKRVTITDVCGKYPKFDQIVEDDANPYFLIDAHVKANGGKPYKVGMSSSAYYGRFFVEQKPVTN
ncbi:hypothetical protein [Caballeronia zhejiangensis]|uniref:hypothetical protein n=1 Tax=Caballeronia zhejiangensis TaxID=871203 RepID=UPI00158D9C16|nr:hypothetical protein [Caballeronia zhejiangensis]MCG7402995.1 hypothetical protein [Caballeronia zhejiangensis]MCI1043820.1 hypothetical protein [Caballeronia zhejiangensis]